jgi:hypothetical protein
VARIDEVNAADPNVLVVDGVESPKELTHARMATEWVLRLDPAATELQLLAARAHHLRRWSVPRGDYDEGRAGYLRWRANLKKRHAAEVGEILRGSGYDDAEVERVQQLVRKEGLGRDPQVQTHEDALCLVFLQTQLSPVADQLGDDRTVEILRKSIAKMSPAGVAAALELPLAPRDVALLKRAAGA